MNSHISICLCCVLFRQGETSQGTGEETKTRMIQRDMQYSVLRRVCNGIDNA